MAHTTEMDAQGAWRLEPLDRERFRQLVRRTNGAAAPVRRRMGFSARRTFKRLILVALLSATLVVLSLTPAWVWRRADWAARDAAASTMSALASVTNWMGQPRPAPERQTAHRGTLPPSAPVKAPPSEQPRIVLESPPALPKALPQPAPESAPAIPNLKPLGLSSVERLTARATLGAADAMKELGDIYLEGRGVSKDAFQGVDWLHKAAAAGNAPAMLQLARFYERGDHFLLTDTTQAGQYIVRSWARPGADDRIAQFQDEAQSGAWQNETLMEVQRQLQQTGFYDGEIDGEIGRGTMKAARDFAAARR